MLHRGGPPSLRARRMHAIRILRRRACGRWANLPPSPPSSRTWPDASAPPPCCLRLPRPWRLRRCRPRPGRAPLRRPRAIRRGRTFRRRARTDGHGLHRRHRLSPRPTRRPWPRRSTCPGPWRPLPRPRPATIQHLQATAPRRTRPTSRPVQMHPPPSRRQAPTTQQPAHPRTSGVPWNRATPRRRPARIRRASPRRSRALSRRA